MESNQKVLGSSPARTKILFLFLIASFFRICYNIAQKMKKNRKEKKMQNSQNALLHLILKSLICGLKCVVRRQSARIGFSLSLLVFSPI